MVAIRRLWVTISRVGGTKRTGGGKKLCGEDVISRRDFTEEIPMAGTVKQEERI